jgi:hypothetical protein
MPCQNGKILLSLARQFEKQPKNAKKEGLNVLHSRRPAGQKFEKALQARLTSPRFLTLSFMPDPPKAGRFFFRFEARGARFEVRGDVECAV